MLRVRVFAQSAQKRAARQMRNLMGATTNYQPLAQRRRSCDHGRRFAIYEAGLPAVVGCDIDFRARLAVGQQKIECQAGSQSRFSVLLRHLDVALPESPLA